MGHSDVSGQLTSPPWATDILLPELRIFKTIWECSCGNGDMVRSMQKRGLRVLASDILWEQDFFTWEPPVQYDAIVTCPTFILKDRYLERAYSLGKPFAFLLPLETLGTAKRQRLFAEHGMELIVFDQRIPFRQPDSGRNTFTVWCGWFTWGFRMGRGITYRSVVL